MIRLLSLAIALLPLVASAQLKPQYTTGSNAPLLQSSYATSSAVTYNVTTTGSDSNTCVGAASCLTGSGALGKIPRLLRHLDTLQFGAGNFGGFVVSGFSCDVSSGSSTVGLVIKGTLGASTLATGTASGTATGGSAGSGQTMATLVDSGQSWTTNDLTGRLLCTSNASVAGYCFPIKSNTSTTITIFGGSGVGGFVTPVGGTTTYTIQDSLTVINTAVNRPGSPLNAQQTNQAGVIAIDNNCNDGREGFITFQNIIVAPSAGRGMLFGGSGGSYALLGMQVRPAAAGFAAVNGVTTATGSAGYGGPVLIVMDSDIYNASPSTSSVLNWTMTSLLTVVGSGIRGASTSATQFGLIASGPLIMSTFGITGTTNGIWLNGIGSPATSINGGTIDCSTYTGSTAISVGNSTTVAGVAGVTSQTGANVVDHVNITVCGTGVLVDGIASAEIHGLTGSVGTQLISGLNSSFIGVNQTNLTPASIVVGDGGAATGWFVNLDSMVLTDAGTDLGSSQNLGICARSPVGSTACGR